MLRQACGWTARRRDWKREILRLEAVPRPPVVRGARAALARWRRSSRRPGGEEARPRSQALVERGPLRRRRFRRGARSAVGRRPRSVSWLLGPRAPSSAGLLREAARLLAERRGPAGRGSGRRAGAGGAALAARSLRAGRCLASGRESAAGARPRPPGRCRGSAGPGRGGGAAGPGAALGPGAFGCSGPTGAGRAPTCASWRAGAWAATCWRPPSCRPARPAAAAPWTGWMRWSGSWWGPLPAPGLARRSCSPCGARPRRRSGCAAERVELPLYSTGAGAATRALPEALALRLQAVVCFRAPAERLRELARLLMAARSPRWLSPMRWLRRSPPRPPAHRSADTSWRRSSPTAAGVLVLHRRRRSPPCHGSGKKRKGRRPRRRVGTSGTGA